MKIKDFIEKIEKYPKNLEIEFLAEEYIKPDIPVIINNIEKFNDEDCLTIFLLDGDNK